ncbi:MAG: serine hydrolase [Firmicutes bacterium]|nr:serine hydrolase [Bacillota bacterium]
MDYEQILRAQEALPGTTAIYYKNLKTGVSFEYNGAEPIIAASVIKIPVMVEFFHQVAEGRICENDLFTIKNEDKLPSCGALTYMHEGLQVTALDLCTLMIILSDNTATNMLIKRLGMANINDRMKLLGLKHLLMTRLLFDGEAQKRGLENRITASEIGILLELIYCGALPHSDKMLDILKKQRLNGKMPFYLHGTPIAHKTGEDDGITHDVGIVFAEDPFILCLLSEKTDVPAYERHIQTTSFLLTHGTQP